ncbi:MAG: histidine--tRNA ligase [Verrucomicrobiota bacterium]
MQLLPGFRDFFPEECARRNYIIATWREVARRYGFVEYDGPMLETVELYEKKSGGEIVGQLFNFEDKGKRHVTLRPEMTPTLARMVIAKEREFKKPLKWFCTPQFFRYEKQQRGRLREFYQLNCDILGEASVAADAEMIALVVDMLREFGLTEENFVVRVSDRDAWKAFLDAHGTFDEKSLAAFLQIVDKMERDTPENVAAKLQAFGISLEELKAFTANPGTHFERFNALAAELDARGLKGFYQLDPTIVRGLAYYTGLVFEVFDRGKTLRAVAGGGRYDNLIHAMSDGKVTLPAIGFGMGDVVLGELINDTPVALEKLKQWVAQRHAADVFVVIANEARRPEALGIVQQLRREGSRVDYALSPAKVGKQFQAAEQAGARFAVLVGEEWPQIKLKTLATREEALITPEELSARLSGGQKRLEAESGRHGNCPL